MSTPTYMREYNRVRSSRMREYNRTRWAALKADPEKHEAEVKRQQKQEAKRRRNRPNKRRQGPTPEQIEAARKWREIY